MEKQWEDMSPDEKQEEMFNRWLSPKDHEGKDLKFQSPQAEKAYKERVTRIKNAIQMKQLPDRVPILPSFGMFPAIDNGYTCEEVMFDYDKAHAAWMKTLQDFEPDAFVSSGYASSGPVLEALDYKQLRLPGRGVDPKHVYQFIEGEYVRAEELYDAFIDDPSDFMLRSYLPRVCGALGPLQMIRPIHESFGYYISIVANLIPLGMLEIAGAIQSIQKAAAEAMKWAMHIGAETQEVLRMGFPVMFGGQSAAPYDVIGDWFRGTQGIMVDMYRCPDKLIQAMEKLVPMLIKMGIDQANQAGIPIVFLMLHKGAEGFMSIDQFKTFYWPGLRKVMAGLIEEGMAPVPLFEGDYTSRLDIIKDIPKGKAIYWFEKVDIYKAKEILGNTVCFRGNVPVTLLCIGTPEDVKAYVKELIDIVGKGGGLIVDCGIWFDEAKHENVKAMVDFTKEYGVYK